MKFSCGENWRHRIDRLETWHPFFAMWPRTIKTENGRDICAWMEWIERKGEYQWDFHLWIWQFREKQ